MARIRTVKPEYPKHRKVRKVSRDARLLNIHLWNLADDDGRLQELVQWIIGEVFPTDEDVTPVLLREWLGELEGAGLIVRYEVADEPYIYCHGFSEHQVINKKRDSVIPPPPDRSTEPDPEPSHDAPVGLRESDGSPTPRKGTGKGNGNGRGMEVAADGADPPLCSLLADLIERNGSNRPTIGKGWREAERLLLERDERDQAEAERLIRWSQADDFWRSNVLSMPKFREKYDTLRLQAQRTNGGGQSKADRIERNVQALREFAGGEPAIEGRAEEVTS